jgi:hypothetical protein
MPVLARVYHIPPHMQGQLTLTQLLDLRRDFDLLNRDRDGN